MQTREYSRWETGSRRSEFIYPETQRKFKGGRISFIEKYGIKCWRSCRNCTRYIVSRLYRSYPEEKCRYIDVRDSIRRLRIAFAYENNIDGTRVSKLLRWLFEKLRKQIDLIALWKKVSERRKNDPYRVHCRFNFYYLRYMRTNDFRLKRIFISGNFTRVLRFIANVLLSNILWLLICIPRFQSVPISYIVEILFRISDLSKKWNSKERQN